MTDKKIIIAIDGFSSCGKSTFAKSIAARLGYVFIDTGAMYRAVTLYSAEHGAIRSGVVDDEAVAALLDQMSIAFRFNPERGASDIYVNGELVEGRIRSIEVSNCVSAVSSIARVREELVAMQQQMGRSKGGGNGRPRHRHRRLPRRGVEDIHDGRCRGCAPDAATTSSRPKGDSVSFEEVYQNVIRRDHADMTRAISPLRQADDAIVLDNSHMTVEEQMAWFMDKFAAATA